MSLSRVDLEQTMSRKTDDELYDVLYAHRQDYSVDAIEVASNEFRRRRLDAPEPETTDRSAERIEAQEEHGLKLGRQPSSTRLEMFVKVLGYIMGVPAFLFEWGLFHHLWSGVGDLFAIFGAPVAIFVAPIVYGIVRG